MERSTLYINRHNSLLVTVKHCSVCSRLSCCQRRLPHFFLGRRVCGYVLCLIVYFAPPRTVWLCVVMCFVVILPQVVLWWACLSVCLSVSLSVCLHLSKTTRPNFTQVSIHVTCGRGSVLLWQRCYMLFISSFVDHVVFADNELYGLGKEGMLSKRACSQNHSPEGSTDFSTVA